MMLFGWSGGGVVVGVNLQKTHAARTIHLNMAAEGVDN